MVCHSLLQWATFCQNSSPWPAHLGWPHTAWLVVPLGQTRLWSMWSVWLVLVHSLVLATFSLCPHREGRKTNTIQFPLYVEYKIRHKRISLKWPTTPVFLHGKSHGRGAWWAIQFMGLQRVGYNWETNAFTLTKQKQTQGHGDQTFGCQGGGDWGGAGVKVWVSGCKLLYTEWISNKAPLYSTGMYSTSCHLRWPHQPR